MRHLTGHETFETLRKNAFKVFFETCFQRLRRFFVSRKNPVKKLNFDRFGAKHTVNHIHFSILRLPSIRLALDAKIPSVCKNSREIFDP